LLFIPLSFIISVPGDPYVLGFRDFKVVKGKQVQVSWDELRRVLGTEKAINLANEYWTWKEMNRSGYWLEHNTCWLDGMKAAITIDAVRGIPLKKAKVVPGWKKAIKRAVEVAFTPIDLNSVLGIFGVQLVSI
jgi:hypothetical protein